MRTCGRVVLAATLWATYAGLAAAQTGIPKDTELNPGRVKPGGTNFAVIGCVSREAANGPPIFVISDSRSKPATRYRLDGDPDLLRFHVGHTVEIAGPISRASGTSAGGGPAAPTLRVDSLTYISTSCVTLQ